MYDVCIIGGGAAGMAAAITAVRKSPNTKIAIIEKNKSLGKKLLSTGNGKCNITNSNCEFEPQVISFLLSNGIVTKEEDQEGRVYPYSEQAFEVVDSLVGVIEGLNVEIVKCSSVEKLEKIPIQEYYKAQDCYKADFDEKEKIFEITVGKKVLYAKKVLLATGGKAGPQFGTIGDGYKFARNFGHTITKLAPVLTYLELAAGDDRKTALENEEILMLKGIRAKGKVFLYKDDILIAEDKGEIQFNGTGLSGICIFNMSRFIKLEKAEDVKEGFKRYTVVIDFMPEYSISAVKNILEEKKKVENTSAIDLLRTIVDQRIGINILKRAGISKKAMASDIAGNMIYDIAMLLKGWKNTVAGAGGWKNAQCTSGGISLDEIDLSVMESKIVSDLYFAGEIIDYDGPCGGYNLQNAWETGIKAGMALVE